MVKRIMYNLILVGALLGMFYAMSTLVLRAVLKEQKIIDTRGLERCLEWHKTGVIDPERTDYCTSKGAS